jgi:hypothetical protein
MSEKMLTDQELRDHAKAVFPEVSTEFVDALVSTARQGMMPADDPLVLDLRGVEWPEEAEKLCMIWFDEDSPIGDFLTITRPAPAWRPKDGNWVWLVHKSGNQLAKWHEVIGMADGSIGRYALGINLNTEKDWAWDQFLARGDVWEVE